MSRTSLLRIALLALALGPATMPATAQEVVVFGGPADAEAWLVENDWWGEAERSRQLGVPRAIITGIHPSWRKRHRR